MPDAPRQKQVPHPFRRVIQPPACAADAPPYAEIQVTTNYTFLTGASHPDELVLRAAELGYRGLAITDVNSLAGVVRMHVAAKEVGLPLAVGCRLEVMADGGLGIADCGSRMAGGEYSISNARSFSPQSPFNPQSAICNPPSLSILVYPTDRAAYGRLCQLLTRGKLRSEKGRCHLTLHDLLDDHAGLLAVVIPPAPPEPIDEHFIDVVRGLKQTITTDRLSIAACCPYGCDDRAHLHRLAALADHVGVPLAATNDVHYHAPVRKPLHDVLACIRCGVTLDSAGFLLKPNAEQHLKPPVQMHRLFAEHPQALARSVSIIERASAFSLDELRYEYPHETCPPGKSPMDHLTDLTWAGAAQRYGAADRIPEKVCRQIRHELALIGELNYPHYFLTVHDIVTFARARQILCQGRGAAANSAVCFCLGITEVDPDRFNLLFERFISRERDEPPDIDVDFEHERREEVIQYLYGKYGRDRAALTAEVITYRSRSAIRDVGKALGLSLDCVDRLAKDREWFDADGIQPKQLRQLGFNPDDPTLIRLAFLVRQILGFPRHLSQHVGGFVLTDLPLCETVPIENAAMPQRTVIEWDKDDIDALGMLKVDVLGLGMLTCVRKCFALIEQHGGPRYEMHTVPAEDPAVYDMMCQADTVGVFQIESRAQMSMLPRLRPREFYDLVIEVAIVRPGPIQGQMVHPYLRRRNGEEQVTYPSEAVKGVLSKTLGVPLFQEQVMALAVVAAGFTPGEADQLRRAIAAWKSRGANRLLAFQERFIKGMLARGYEPDFAERCFNQIKGFGDYGFPESHAASFALIAYVSAWLKRHHPAAFAAALINSQPMGFYAPAQIVRDAKEHGIEVLPIDVNRSSWDCTLEKGKLRLGMRLVKGLREEDAGRISDAVARRGPLDNMQTLWRAGAVPVPALRRLASADAFASMGLDRQRALWQVRELRDVHLPLFDEPLVVDGTGRLGCQCEARTGAGKVEHWQQSLPVPSTDDPHLPPIPDAHKVLHDYAVTGLSLKSHPMSFLRARLDALRITASADLRDPARCPNGTPVAVAGLVLVRQRPGTASGIVFMTIEDETGIANLILRARVFDRFRRAAAHSRIVLARGTVERDATGQVVHVMVKSIHDIGRPDGLLRQRQRNFH